MTFRGENLFATAHHENATKILADSLAFVFAQLVFTLGPLVGASANYSVASTHRTVPETGGVRERA